MWCNPVWSAGLHGGQGVAYGRVQVISAFRIRNFKSIQDLTLKLGRVTVMIGENGSGKSNILEALGFAGCAAAGKLDNAV
jgi:predicted ATPase